VLNYRKEGPGFQAYKLQVIKACPKKHKKEELLPTFYQLKQGVKSITSDKLDQPKSNFSNTL